MKSTRTLHALVSGFLACVAVVVPAWAAPAKSTSPVADSVYQLSVPLTDQNGKKSTLADWRGKPVMISMFYSSCQFVCPRIVEAVKRTESQLAGKNAQVPVLLVTLDPARDDVATLKSMSEDRNLDPKLWTLARTDARNVRKLSAALGIQYRELPSGEFNHSSVIILLDAEGRVAGKTSTLGEADPVFVKLVQNLKK